MPDSASKNARSACLAEQIAMADRPRPLADVMPVISTSPLTGNCRQRSFLSAIGSKRLRYK